MTRLAPHDIKRFVADCGYHCRGEIIPAHICKPVKLNGKPKIPTKAESDALPSPSTVKPVVEKVKSETPQFTPIVQPPEEEVKAETKPTVPAKSKNHAGHKMNEMSQDKAAMAQEMGHGTDESMEAMGIGMRNRLFFALFFTVFIFLYSPMFVKLAGFEMPLPFGISLELMGFILATPVVLYGGWVFYVGAYRALKNGIANMAVLVSLSVLAGYSFSVGATFFFRAEVFYEAVAVLLVFILLGHWLEMRARSGASKAVQALLIPFPARNYAIKGGNPRVSKGVRKCAIGALAYAQASALMIDNFS